MQMCKAIDDAAAAGKDIFVKLYGAANVYYNTSGTVSCFDLNDDSDPHDLGGWAWQVSNSTSPCQSQLFIPSHSLARENKLRIMILTPPYARLVDINEGMHGDGNADEREHRRQYLPGLDVQL